jgi:LuxR family transcriptional regulator
MLNVVASVISYVSEANDHAELHDAIQFGLSELDFASYNLSCHRRSKHQLVMTPTLTSWSKEGVSSYDAAQWYERDPLLAYAFNGRAPKAWAPQEWRGCTQFGDYADYLDRVGILSGVTAPLTSQPGTFSVFTAISISESALNAGAADAVYIVGQAAMLRAEALGLIKANQPSTIGNALLDVLTAQQVEILEWARQGKSNGDIALITGRSKRGVAYHMSEILRKLDVSTRTQAVAAWGLTIAGPSSGG